MSRVPSAKHTCDFCGAVRTLTWSDAHWLRLERPRDWIEIVPAGYHACEKCAPKLLRTIVNRRAE